MDSLNCKAVLSQTGRVHIANDIVRDGRSPRLSKAVTHGISGKVLWRARGNRIVKFYGVLIMIACISSETYGQAVNARNTSAVPILVELFTSEGCSSCPPADDLLQQMDVSQPAPGAQLIVLSEHVDYWNHDGWKDPYSSSSLTERQSGYVRSLGLNTAYTPQMIVDGASELKATGTQQLIQALQKAASAPKIPVRISSLSVEAASAALLRAHIEVDGTPQKHNADIYVVVALDHSESQVLRGENTGRHLAHVAVAEEFIRIGKLEKQKSFSKDIQIKLKPGIEPTNIRVIAFVQEPGPGKVLGAALQKNTTNIPSGNIPASVRDPGRWLVLFVASRLQDFAQIVMASRDSFQMRVTYAPGILNFAGFHGVKVANNYSDLAVSGMRNRFV